MGIEQENRKFNPVKTNELQKKEFKAIGGEG